ncbi:MAG: hypothetical protein HKP59_04645 [Lutibacter sp.]|uniref:DUF6090 family protein n=1 Tax=Lutibacter sp. TaxID=1925666 RepID=UPI0017C49A6B|nr:DUF6090 family protein [Lutibacter sp.]MBT8316891.1 hypothetical protein [Lutibacter sp.]NNJ57751.1 hypothetical protein [Lutibacter sp.]
MIKFFRKIRQKMLTENKFSKYLLYAIGEIILVIIGILIALSINNWNENNKLEELKQVYYQQLLIDLNKDKEYIIEKINLYNSRIEDYENYLNTFKKPNLSIHEVLQNQNKLNFATDNIRFQNSTIETLENTGNNKLIPVDIANRLTELKRSQELVIEFTNLNYGYYMDNIKQTGLSGSIPGFEERLKNQPELKEYLNIENNSDKIIVSIEYAQYLKIYNERTNIKQFKEILTNIEAIIELINSDI